MKNKNIKKIIIGCSIFALLFITSNVFAASIWNNTPNDCHTIAISNYTTNTGSINPCWSLSSVNANLGDSVNIRIYYHNTSFQNATNVKIILNTSTNISNNHLFFGQIISNQGSISFGPVLINTPNGTSLSWRGTRWLSNQTQSNVPLLSNQTGIEILSQGLNIGTITPGWNSQGFVIITFSVIGQNILPPSIFISNFPFSNNHCLISNFSANKTNVKLGNPVILSWDTNNCASANITNLGNVSTFGTYLVYPKVNTNYTLRAYSYNNGTQPQTISIIVNKTKLAPIYNSCAVTTIATGVNKHSATLNGIITNSNSNSIDAYFEYGPTISLRSRTPTQSYNNNILFSNNITNLLPETIYYFRTVSNCKNKLNYGTIEIFKTSSSQTISPIIIKDKIIKNSNSSVLLKIEDHYKLVNRGDNIEYTVTYKNINQSKLINPILQVVVPKGIIITNASNGTYVKNSRTLTLKLDNLKSGQSGILYVKGKVISVPVNTTQIVTTVLLVYTNINNTQENIIAYVLNTPNKTNNSLGAAALFSELLGFGLIGWLLIIILILVIILIVHQYFYQPKTIKISRKVKK